MSDTGPGPCAETHEIAGLSDLSSSGNRAVMFAARENERRGEGDPMKTTIERARESVQALGDVPKQLAELALMSVAQLQEKYRELYGEPTHTRNRDYLRKRLAWRVQELAEGGLSERSLSKIIELGDELPERWRMRRAETLATEPATAPVSEPTTPAPTPVSAPTAPRVTPPQKRDPRLPPVGTVLTRAFNGTNHEVTVTEDGFLYAGQSYRTLSAVARQITGTQWNGFTFFGLPKQDARSAA